MEARYAMRKTPLLDACPVAPEIFAQVIPRLSTSMEPFVTPCQGQGGAQQATTSVCGLLSDVAQNNVAALASRVGQSRLPLQGFLGWAEGDDAPWRSELSSPGNRHLGPGDGVVVCDPAACPKSGRE
jgi:hypothetical protein